MERYSALIKKGQKIIIISWIILTFLLLPIAPKINDIIVYQVEISLPNSNFQLAVDKLNEEFSNKTYSEAFLNVLASYNYYIIIQSKDVYSDKVKNIDYKIREKFENYSGKFLLSFYKLNEILLQQLAKNVTNYVRSVYNYTWIIYNQSIYLKNLILDLNYKYNLIKETTNKSLYFSYFIPSIFLECYNNIKVTDFNLKSELAKNCTILITNPKGVLLDYFESFYKNWLILSNEDINLRADVIIKNIAPIYLEKYFYLNKLFINTIFSYSNILNWKYENTLIEISKKLLDSFLPNSLSHKELLLEQIILINNNNIDINKAIYNILINSLNSTKPNLNKKLIDKLVFDVVNNDIFNREVAINITSEIVTLSIEKIIKNNPYFVINEDYFKDFLKQLIFDEPDIVVNETIRNLPYWMYPIILKDNIKSSLIDEKDGIFLIIAYSKHYPTTSEIEHDLKYFDDLKKELENDQVKIYITGVSMLSYELRIGVESSLSIIIPLGVLFVFLIASLYFKSPVAGGLILLLFAISISISFSLIYLLLGYALNRHLSFISPAILVVLVLGLCSDYAIYLLRRYKIEREEGKSKEEAIKAMTIWSARGVITSALAVLFAYLILSLMNIPLFGDASTANTIGVAVTLMTNIFFFPSLISVLNDKIFWPSKYGRSKNRAIMKKIANFNEKNKKSLTILLISSALISLLLVFNIQTVLDVPPLMPPSEVQKGALLLYSTIGSSMSPIYIFIQGEQPVISNGSLNKAYIEYVENITNGIKSVKDVKYIYSIISPFGKEIDVNEIMNEPDLRSIYSSAIERFVGISNKGVLMLVIIDKQPFSLDAIEVLKEIESKIPKNPDFELYIDGVTQLSYDSKTLTDSVTPMILIGLIAVIMILLFLQLISLLIPLRLIFTILSSVLWSLALLYLVYNVLMGLPLINAVPVFLVVTMLGVGVDYDIFLLTRVREEVVKGKSDEEAIRIALEKVGPTIMVLGLLLGGTFLLLLLPNFPLMNEIGFSIGLSVLFDSFLIILFFVPSIMLLAKKWNWWPSKLARKE